MLTRLQVHNWDKLEAAGNEKSDDPSKEQARVDLNRLLQCVKGSPELQGYFKTRMSNSKTSVITYATMWTLFPPGTKVVAKLYMDTPQIFEISWPPIPEETPAPPKLRTLIWCWNWDGKEMVKAHYWVTTNRFRGTREINKLPCYPLEYYKDGTKTSQDFCAVMSRRGAEYNKIVRSAPGATQTYMFTGNALTEWRSVIKADGEEVQNVNKLTAHDYEHTSVTQERRKVFITGRVIVDAAAFLNSGAGVLVLGQHEPAMVGDMDGTTHEENTSNVVGSNGDVESNNFLLYPPRVLGFSTREKVWGQFGVDQIEPTPRRHMGKFKDQLQLGQRDKEMIQALVDEHEGKAARGVQIQDIVEDKGKGLVLLLHGPPGVGKTLTAETIAEGTGRPLLVVSVAEIGLNASKAEANLEQMFYLASKWEAVLLVDEADVFLEARTGGSDSNRNALVSVLLRVLEYYTGMLVDFLFPNLVEQGGVESMYLGKSNDPTPFSPISSPLPSSLANQISNSLILTTNRITALGKQFSCPK